VRGLLGCGLIIESVTGSCGHNHAATLLPRALGQAMLCRHKPFALLLRVDPPPPPLPPPCPCSHVAELSSVLLSCLPGFWATASSGRLADVPDLPPAVRARLRQSLKTVAATAQKLVRDTRG
jgi:hypothetical protein